MKNACASQAAEQGFVYCNICRTNTPKVKQIQSSLACQIIIWFVADTVRACSNPQPVQQQQCGIYSAESLLQLSTSSGVCVLNRVGFSLSIARLCILVANLQNYSPLLSSGELTLPLAQQMERFYSEMLIYESDTNKDEERISWSNLKNKAALAHQYSSVKDKYL